MTFESVKLFSCRHTWILSNALFPSMLPLLCKITSHQFIMKSIGNDLPITIIKGFKVATWGKSIAIDGLHLDT